MEATVQIRVAVVAAPGRAAYEIRRALGRLGGEVAVEVLPASPIDARALADRRFDLVILDDGIGPELLPVLRGRPPGAAPVLVVCDRLDEALALEAFAAGAADCVVRGAPFDEALPIAVLEQIRRHRAASEQGAAEALTRQIQNLRRYTENIIENMNGALVVVDLEGTVTFANPTAERILGAEERGLVGTLLWPRLDPRQGGRALVERTLTEGVRFRGSETSIVRPDGGVVPIGLSCAPWVDAEGVTRGAVAIFQDLTEIKQLQRQVLQTEKMASIGQLAAGVAHEINNPMGFIHANLFQLGEYLEDLERVWERLAPLRKACAAGDGVEARRLAAELDRLAESVDADFLIADSRKAVRESLDGAERIRHIVQDLRAFSHQDTGERALADVNECLDSTAHIVWTMMKHSVVLTKQYRRLPPLACYPMQLKQVFMNLLVNAYQAIEESPRAEGGRGEIRLSTRDLGDAVEIAVADDGVGIAPELQARIFDPFFTTKDVGVGTGLGLSTSYNIIRRHGGELRVESEPGRGSRFTIRLPLAPGRGAAPAS